MDQQHDITRPSNISIKDIARHCQVSTSTVSLALRHDSRVSPAMTERILTAAGQLGYRPNATARRLVMTRYYDTVINRLAAISLPLGFYGMRFFSDLFTGVLQEFDARGFALLTLTHLGIDAPIEEQTIAFRNLVRHEVDGLIVFSPSTRQDHLTELRAHHSFGDRVIVSLLGALPGCSSVSVDDEMGAYLSMHHLIALGHQHVLCFIHPSDDPHTLARKAGWRRALREAGYCPDECLHYRTLLPEWGKPRAFTLFHADTPVSVNEQRVNQIFLEDLQAHPQITAICAVNDACAGHAWQALLHAGLRVPQDYSIIGFDDTDAVYNELGENVLTTLRVPLTEIGQQAASLLVRRVKGELVADTDIILPVELIIRNSTAPPHS